MAPKYPHDCAACVFVGHDSDGDDVYWCPSHLVPFSLVTNRRVECVVVRYREEEADAIGEFLFERPYWHRTSNRQHYSPLSYPLSALLAVIRAGHICKTVADCILSGVESI